MVLLASSYDESKYFKAVDLEGDHKLRIKSVTDEAIGVGIDKQQKLVVWFTNDKRGLVLNRVNNRTLRGAFGDPVDGWTGKIIIVFPMMVEMRGKMVPGLRVRVPPPQHSGETAVKPKSSGNGQTAAPTQPKRPVEEELNAIDESAAQTEAGDLDDEIPF
jgi:hypothetical protein